MSEWERSTLGEVLTEIKDKNADGSIDLVLSVTERRGIIPQTDVYKKRIATDDVTGYKVLSPGDIAWNPYLLWCGAIGQWLGDEPGVTSPVYPVYRAVAGQDSRFWGLVLESGHLTDYFDSTAIGSISRRRRTTPSVFEEAVVEVPPLAEQRRIVDVMAAVDAQIEALEVEASALATSVLMHRARLVNDPQWTAVRAEEAFDFSAGVRRTPDRANGSHMTPYLRSANVGYGELDLSDVLEMHYDENERERFGLRYGDVLVSEGSASAKAVGMPSMWRDELPSPVCFQMTLLRLRAIAGRSIPEFLFHWCMWAYESGAFLNVCGGSTIKHISARRSSQMAVRLPPLDDQAEIGDLLASLDSQLRASRLEAAVLHAFRSTLLSVLLSQQVEIPESYDALLDDAVEVSA